MILRFISTPSCFVIFSKGDNLCRFLFLYITDMAFKDGDVLLKENNVPE